MDHLPANIRSMQVQFTRLTLKVHELDLCLQFYELIGLRFEKKTVILGGEYHLALVGPVEFCLFFRREEEVLVHPTFQFSFKVNGVYDLVKKLRDLKLCRILLAPQEMPDGRKAIVLDPEGHSVELIEIR